MALGLFVPLVSARDERWRDGERNCEAAEVCEAAELARLRGGVPAPEPASAPLLARLRDARYASSGLGGSARPKSCRLNGLCGENSSLASFEGRRLGWATACAAMGCGRNLEHLESGDVSVSAGGGSPKAMSKSNSSSAVSHSLSSHPAGDNVDRAAGAMSAHSGGTRGGGGGIHDAAFGSKLNAGACGLSAMPTMTD